MALAPERARALLLDIEGTTTPVAFVLETLFPFARARLAEFLVAHWPELRAEVELLRAEHARDAEGPPPWEDSPRGVGAYAAWLMDRDRKSTGLKSLQGKIWQEGFADGRLRGQVYPDVLPALARWRAQGRRVAIFSSGSVLAQKLLFAHSSPGDLTPLLDAFFDTTSGPKASPDSYRRIAGALGLLPDELLFLSDTVAELDAARAAGLHTALTARDAPPTALSSHPVVRTFDEVFASS